ncbi:MAG: hypothetical protein IK090_04025 [Clostridia bacterium]|nr:hypothetical protein [Clostridia bacterium]
MKKVFFALLLLCLTVLLFARSGKGERAKQSVFGSGGETEPLTVRPLPYGKNAAVVEGDYHADEAAPAFIDSRRVSNPVPKEFTLFGKRYTLYPTDVVVILGYYATDQYSGNSTFVNTRADTGKIVSFQTVPSYARDYVSPVREGAGEEEYLAYAKSILNDVAGVSTDGWEATVRITSTKYANERGYFVLRNGTVLSLAEEDYEATVGSRVSVTFTKKIGAFERFDEMKVEMTGAGEVISFNAKNYDEAFAPFVGVTPDRARIERAVSPLVSSYAHGLDSHVEKIVMYVDDGTLWAQVFILITGPEGASAGVTFSVEVAKIEE